MSQTFKPNRNMTPYEKTERLIQELDAVCAGSQTEYVEKRQGKTGVWTFVVKTYGGKIRATAEWGTDYEFAEKEWNELPIVHLEEAKEMV